MILFHGSNVFTDQMWRTPLPAELSTAYVYAILQRELKEGKFWKCLKVIETLTHNQKVSSTRKRVKIFFSLALPQRRRAQLFAFKQVLSASSSFGSEEATSSIFTRSCVGYDAEGGTGLQLQRPSLREVPSEEEKLRSWGAVALTLKLNPKCNWPKCI